MDRDEFAHTIYNYFVNGFITGEEATDLLDRLQNGDETVDESLCELIDRAEMVEDLFEGDVGRAGTKVVPVGVDPSPEGFFQTLSDIKIQLL